MIFQQVYTRTIVMYTHILKQLPFLNKLSQKAGEWPNLFIFFSPFRIYPIWFIYMQQETRNRMGSCQTMKREKRTSPNQSDCNAYPMLKQSPFLNELSWKAGDGTDLFVFSSSFRTYFIWFIFRQQKTRNRIGSCRTVKCAEKILPKSEPL